MKNNSKNAGKYIELIKGYNGDNNTKFLPIVDYNYSDRSNENICSLATLSSKEFLNPWVN